MNAVKSINFFSEQTDNFDDFVAFCSVFNHHCDACTHRKVGIGEMYECYRYRGPKQEKHLSEIIIRDSQTNKVWVIQFETFDSENRYSALHLSPAASEVRNYAYKQWKRLEAKNSAHYVHSTKNIEC